MSPAASPRPESDRIPNLLPDGLIARRIAQAPSLLCLDFDGTISEITDDPWQAVPLPRAKTAIAALARRPDQLRVAIVSGRDLDTLFGLLGLREGLLFAGTHGLEIVDADGTRRVTPGLERCADDIARLREFLARNIPRDRGFIIEDKRVALTLNYRNARPDDAREALALFDRFVTTCPSLQLLEGKMIHEAIPKGIGGKGDALEVLMRAARVPASQTIYFGDDTTDENAFRLLVPRGGVGVLVGSARPSFAQYRIESPAQVADILEALVAQL